MNLSPRTHGTKNDRRALLPLLLLGAFGFAAPAWAQAAPANPQPPAAPPAGVMARPADRPQLWMGPPARDNGRGFRELFDKPEAWRETRAVVDVLMYADHNLKRYFSDDELRPWLAQLRQWNIKFAMEVGAIKPWGITGEKCFAAERPNWERIERLGGKIYAIAMDEPLCCTRHVLHKSDDYAVQETANYIALVRKRFPDVLIGDIETYPAVIPLADHFQWIESLQKRLAETKVRGLDFYRLDVDWVHFIVHDRGSWVEVKKLEEYCRQRKLPFSLVYWAADYGALRRVGLADDTTWYVSLMQHGYDYALVHGSPDQYVVQSWVNAPSRVTPETDQWTFTRSVLDFSRKFVQRKPPAAAGNPAR
jgi:hypothetical protein